MRTVRLALVPSLVVLLAALAVGDRVAQSQEAPKRPGAGISQPRPLVRPARPGTAPLTPRECKSLNCTVVADNTCTPTGQVAGFRCVCQGGGNQCIDQSEQQ